MWRIVAACIALATVIIVVLRLPSMMLYPRALGIAAVTIGLATWVCTRSDSRMPAPHDVDAYAPQHRALVTRIPIISSSDLARWRAQMPAELWADTPAITDQLSAPITTPLHLPPVSPVTAVLDDTLDTSPAPVAAQNLEQAPMV